PKTESTTPRYVPRGDRRLDRPRRARRLRLVLERTVEPSGSRLRGSRRGRRDRLGHRGARRLGGERLPRSRDVAYVARRGGRRGGLRVRPGARPRRGSPLLRLGVGLRRDRRSDERLRPTDRGTDNAPPAPDEDRRRLLAPDRRRRGRALPRPRGDGIVRDSEILRG